MLNYKSDRRDTFHFNYHLMHVSSRTAFNEYLTRPLPPLSFAEDEFCSITQTCCPVGLLQVLGTWISLPLI